MKSKQTNIKTITVSDLQLPAVKQIKSGRVDEGSDSDSDFESDPPSPKSSEDEEEEGEELLTCEHGEDTEADDLGQNPLLTDSDDEDDDDDVSVKSRQKKSVTGRRSPPADSSPSTLITPPNAVEAVDVFRSAPFHGGIESAGIISTQVSPEQQPHPRRVTTDDFDVFTKAPFSRHLSKSSSDVPLGQTPPLSLESIDMFGFSPFEPPGSTAPPPVTSRSADDIFRPPLDESASCQQPPHHKQRSLHKLSSRQRKTRQDAASKRHHGTPTGGRKINKPTYRTPERVRRHKKVGRRDSQSSNEFLSASDSKENIGVDVTMAPSVAADDAILDPFGAKPFHLQDVCRHHGVGDGMSLRESETMDDFGAVPFTELAAHKGLEQQGAPSQPLDLDPFGAAPFPTKH